MTKDKTLETLRALAEIEIGESNVAFGQRAVEQDARAARSQALEEAAKIAEELSMAEDRELYSDWSQLTADKIAAAIRERATK